MKKIMILTACLLMLSACGKKEEKSVVCTMRSKDSIQVETEYFYDSEHKMTRMEEVNTLTLNEEDLKQYTLDEYLNELKNLKLYKEAENENGIKIEFKKNEDKKEIQIIVSIDFTKYDFIIDVFSLGDEEEFANIDEYVEVLNAYGISECGKVQ